MSLLDQVKVICTRLSEHGWKELFLQHGLDITSDNLKEELLQELPNINRNIEGFEDFAFEGKRGIEPHDPARSLLFHGFASPNVIKKADGSNLDVFPSLNEIEIIENYVHGISPISIPEIRQIANNSQSIGIVVFSSEYRPAPETPHKKHADMCFSRTGISRVGTKDLQYHPKFRGFIPFDNNKNNIRVLPCKFSAYIALREKGNRDIYRPMRFRNNDDQLDFWIPIYKIFEGDECIRDINLTLRYESFHINEKLKRIHVQLNGAGGWSEPDISNKPFVFTDGIAEFSNTDEFGTGFLVPIVHSNLVEQATYNDEPLTFTVPPNTQTLSSSMLIPPRGNWRLAPEYVHVRHEITSNNTENNLNDNENVVDIIRTGNYQAKHYIDFTGDGWIKAVCPELSTEFTTNILAYSLVTAPDFFPYADQRELMDWWEQKVSDDLRERIWRIPPNTLSDERIAANLQLPNSPFNPGDKTTTAIVSMSRGDNIQNTSSNTSYTDRHSHLPDAASGVFAPGWDISVSVADTLGQTEHLASYGLGSPFPEDAKLCAALSTFWPAVAPDTARTFEPNPSWPTVAPLTDEEIGIIGNNPWDGIRGPQLVTVNGRNYVEYTKFDFADYVEQTLDNNFSLSLTGKIDIDEYKSRLIAMARVYKTLDIERGQLSVLSFTFANSNDDEFVEAQRDTNIQLDGDVYKFKLYRYGNNTIIPSNDHKKIQIPVLILFTFFVSRDIIIFKNDTDTSWHISNA